MLMDNLFHYFIKRKDANDFVSITDRKYEDKYGSLFPDDKEIEEIAGIADMMDEPSPETRCSLRFIYAIEDIYKEYLENEEEVPDVDDIYEYVIEWIEEGIIRKCEEDHANVERFWRDEFFREQAEEDYREMYWNSVEAYELNDYIREALDFLGFTYYDYNRVGSPAQLAIFPELDELF